MKKLVLIMAISVVLFGMVSVSNATSILGVYCFKMDTFSDTFVWTVEKVDNVYQVTGKELANGVCAMNGGGQVINNHLIMTVDEACVDNGLKGEHGIDIDLSTLTGTTDLVWHYSDGSVGNNYVDLTFTRITCPAADAVLDSKLPTTSGN